MKFPLRVPGKPPMRFNPRLPLDPSCVLYLPMREGAGTKCFDQSIFGNHGAIGGATWKAGGKIGSCLDFDGNNDYVQIAGLEDGKPLKSNWSFNCWFKADSFDNNGENRHELIFLGKTGSASSPYGESFSLETKDVGTGDDRISCWIYAIGSDTIQGTTSLNINTWYMATLTYDSSTDTMKLYLDGILEKTHTSTGVSTSAKIGEFGLGQSVDDAMTWGAGRFDFDGKMDEVLIYNRVLSAEEIKMRYLLTKF